MDNVTQSSSGSFAANSNTEGLAASAEDAELLLRHASQTGIQMPDDVVAIIVRARSQGDSLTYDEVAKFYSAYSQLAAKLQPVSIDTLRVPESSTRAALRRNGFIAVLLAVAVMICSITSFLTNSMSTDIDNGINHANELAVKLRDQVGPPRVPLEATEICVQPKSPPDPSLPTSESAMLTGELQDFSATIRTVLTTAINLGKFVPQREISPLNKPAPNPVWETSPRDMLQLHPELIDQRAEAFCKIYAYEDVRNFARNVRADSLAVYGALATYFLPVLYAMLGACAFAMRDFSENVKRRTYHPSSCGNTARTIAAMTAGAIISLFGNLSQGLSLSPLALAFLVGYGVEAFFAFLDNLLTMLRGDRGGPPIAGAGKG